MSKHLPWFRLYHRIIDDEKIRLLAFEDRWHFIAICCLKADGLIDEPEGDLKWRKIAVKMGVQMRELDEIKRRLSEVGLVDDNMSPIAWNELQYKSDTSTERVKRYREKNKKNNDETQGNVSVTPQETETEANTETDISSLRSDSARDRFEDFEKAYPKPMGSDRSRARRAFDKLCADDQVQAISAATQFARARESDRKVRGETCEQAQRFTPNASRWLDEGGWQNLESPPKPSDALVTIKADTADFAVIERYRGKAIRVGMKRTITVTQSELDAARQAEHAA